MTAKIILKKNEDKRIRSGHLWIFSNEIFKTEENPESGDLVEVYDSKDNYLGTGFYNKNSLISVRIISYDKNFELETLLKTKLNNAFNLRKTFYPERDSFRLVFSESDFLPGLIIDKYNKTFVLQIYSFGMQKNINLITKILKENFNAENIFTKNESYFRKLEGLPENDEIFFGEKQNEIISDGEIKFNIDFEKGQKTGFYFDQNDNRFFVHKIVKGKRVLDAFCNSGGFGLHAAKAGASSVTFVDSSSNEIENAESNFKLNELNCEKEFAVSDVFDYLNKFREGNKKFDVVIVDPPAFAKSKKDIPTAKKGYEKLNRLALNIIEKEGFLVTSSCSHHIKRDDFLEIINNASVKTGRKIQLVHFNSASLDHPQIPSMPETVYLKFAVFKVE